MIAARGKVVIIEVEALEEIPDTTRANARGDGISIASFFIHKVDLVAAKPVGPVPDAGTRMSGNQVYTVGREEEDIDFVPVYLAKESSDGDLGTLLQTLNEVKGPPRDFIEKTDAKVDAQEIAALAAERKKN